MSSPIKISRVPLIFREAGIKALFFTVHKLTRSGTHVDVFFSNLQEAQNSESLMLGDTIQRSAKAKSGFLIFRPTHDPRLLPPTTSEKVRCGGRGISRKVSSPVRSFSLDSRSAAIPDSEHSPKKVRDSPEMAGNRGARPETLDSSKKPAISLY